MLKKKQKKKQVPLKCVMDMGVIIFLKFYLTRMYITDKLKKYRHIVVHNTNRLLPFLSAMRAIQSRQDRAMLLL